MRRGSHALGLIATLATISACAEVEPPRFQETEQDSGTTARLQAVWAVDERVVWASGLEGTVLRTLDGGATWTLLPVPGAEELQFRDVHGFGPDVAFLLSAGEGEQSRIYKTEDGGSTWTLQFLNLDPAGFFDCFDFWDAETGVVYGDSVDGVLYVLTTSNGGETWARVPASSLPSAGAGEGGFAASGTCVAAGAEGRVWVGTGAGGNARVLRGSNFGRQWDAVAAPVVRGDVAGLMSVVMADSKTGVALGGDLRQPDTRTANVATTRNGGETWEAGGPLRLAGAAYGGAVAPGERRGRFLFLATGPGGLDLSVDRGATWLRVSDGDYWSVDFGGPNAFWAVGPDGRITRFDRRP